MKIIIGLVVVLALAFVFIIFQPQAFLPHQKIVIGLPFDKNDPPTGMIPMGETIAHPKPRVPNGHPGIDFGWQHNSKILSSSDGEITRITNGTSDPGKWDIEVQSGNYFLRYKELEDYDQSLKVSSKVKKGDLLGHPGASEFPDHPGKNYQIHWELASTSLILDRWCPVNYFDPESKKIIEDIWAKVPTNDRFKAKFPYICSGDYFGKEEK